MSKFRKSEGSPAVIVPRWWLIALLAVAVMPWLVVWAVRSTDLFGRTPGPSAGPGSATAGEVSASQASGSWGKLELTPIVISPPIEYVSTNWAPATEPVWHFPTTSNASLTTFLTTSGLGAQDASQLLATAKPDPSIQGVVVRPGVDLIRRLSPEVRGRIYLQLAKSPLNDSQAEAFRFFGSSTDAWLGSGLSPAIRQLIDPLVYRERGFLFFADFDLVRSQISDPQDLQRLVKRLMRQATVLVKLHVDATTDVGPIADYWGRGGRRTDIRPLLESIAAAGPGADHSIDILHLLPPIAREHLYRYPRVSVADFDKPLLSNCFWTALNFFNAQPDDRFLDVAFALKHLKEDYYVIQDGFQLGDIVAFSDNDGNLFHVAVFLADNLVFGKNGSSYLAPWSILPMERLRGHYIENADSWHITVHRRKDL